MPPVFLSSLTEGRTEGRAEGRAEERKRLAQKLIVSGMPLSQVAELSELSEQEVQQLFDSLSH